jgi:hypothetical protein
LFKVLLAALNRNSGLGRVGGILWGCCTAYWYVSVIALGASVGLGMLTGSWYVGITFLLAALLSGLGFAIYHDLTRGLVANTFGMCKGLTTNPKLGPALTPWLHEQIQTAAGRSAGDDPLTFGDLWGAPDFPPDWIPIPAGIRIRSIDLQMFTTNLSHGRPYIFPHTDKKARLFFDPGELRQYMPEDVMNWIEAHAEKYRKVADGEPDESSSRGLLELPKAEDVPVLLAARMSLSFPILFSALPLWAIDFEKPWGQRCFKRCVFSDGGISSNFPMHLFDGLVTTWPTFGVQLEGVLEDHRNRVYLPQRYDEGYGDRWNRFDEEHSPAGRFGGFIAAIVGTMQNWNDNTLARMPGVRDRVVRVRLSEDEGGMNLNMESKLIESVANYGRHAADELLAHFGKANGAIARGWDEQRWTRLSVLINGLRQRLIGLAIALGPDVGHATSYDDLVRQSGETAPPGHSEKLSPSEVAALQALLDSLKNLASEFARHSQQYSHTPIPEPELRIRPPL